MLDCTKKRDTPTILIFSTSELSLEMGDAAECRMLVPVLTVSALGLIDDFWIEPTLV